MSFDELFGAHRVMVVLRGMPSATDAITAAIAAWDARVELVEVPIGDLADVGILSAVVRAGEERGKLVGAGTIVSPQHVSAAREAGARYTVAPGFDRAVLEASTSVGLPHLPGVATPTEVHHARAAGCRWVKVFPAGVLWPAWFEAIRGPFPDVNYVATGGIRIDMATEYLEAGASIVAFGAAVTRRRADLMMLVRKSRNLGDRVRLENRGQ